MSRRPKKRCAVCGQDIVPDPLVDPGNPPHRHQACTTAHSTRAHHRMVTLAKSSPSRSTTRPSQKKSATVMLAESLPHQHVIRKNRSLETTMEILLYYAPIACSLVPYVTLTEANASFEVRTIN